MAHFTPPEGMFHVELSQREIDLLAGVLGQTEGDDNEMYRLYRAFKDHAKQQIKFSHVAVNDGTDNMMLVRK